ncbi:hypothetical protein [Nocardiopsis sp. B62]|uniref:hypothetical protein n=1 Tax=Nocardiopsis sp. B62 TaxID=2824874 RepID=UPI001B397F07|nr:hypothetical protein [Nocardiopsis sp. B62]MBQ1080361.1 hypothetical protein [Nocardiopsis sp. B62]
MHRFCTTVTCALPLDGDDSVCPQCVRRLTRALDKVVGGLPRDLDLALARQRRTGPGNLGRRSTETPLAFDPAITEASAVLQGTLSAWCRTIQEPGVPGPTGNDSSALASWLSRHTGALRRNALGTECVDEVCEAVEQAERAVDLPSDRVIAGLCPGCATPCYARSGATSTRCPECETRVSVGEGRRRMLLGAGEHLVTAADAARALQVLGHRVTPASVRGHARRGRLRPRGTGSAGRPLYCLGDVVDVYLSRTCPGDRPLRRHP